MSLLRRFVKVNLARLTLTSNRMPIISTTIQNDENEHNLFFMQKRFAARKGKRIAATREKQKLARIRREEEKKLPPKVWRPPKFTLNKNLKFVPKKFNDDHRRELDEIVDNVYIIEQYKEQKLSLVEALELIRETHSPDIYGEPDALVEAKLELNLKTKKKTKFLQNLSGVIAYPHLFPFSVKRKVIAICKTDEQQSEAREAGAELAGSSDIVRMLKVGDLSIDNFDDIVCHEEIFDEVCNIRSVLGFSLPSKQRGNIGTNMTELVNYFVNGIEFKMVKDHLEPDYGFLKAPFGRLTQTDEELKDNFARLLKIIDSNQPEGAPCEFITRVLIYSDPSPEKFAVSFWQHIDGYEDPNVQDEDEEDNNEKNAPLAKTNVQAQNK